MKALLLEAPKNFKSIEIEPPSKPGPGEALVRVHRVGICGTDISGYWSWDALPSLSIAVGLVELPVNALLYVHLARLSRRFDGPGGTQVMVQAVEKLHARSIIIDRKKEFGL